MSNIVEPIREYRCWRCKGEGKLGYLRETPDGPEWVREKCPGCGGKGSVKIEVKR